MRECVCACACERERESVERECACESASGCELAGLLIAISNFAE